MTIKSAVTAALEVELSGEDLASVGKGEGEGEGMGEDMGEGMDEVMGDMFLSQGIKFEAVRRGTGEGSEHNLKALPHAADPNIEMI